jgi:hypothetical protein
MIVVQDLICSPVARVFPFVPQPSGGQQRRSIICCICSQWSSCSGAERERRRACDLFCLAQAIRDAVVGIIATPIGTATLGAVTMSFYND